MFMNKHSNSWNPLIKLINEDQMCVNPKIRRRHAILQLIKHNVVIPTIVGF